MPALRVVLDTNVLISGTGYSKSIPGRILAGWLSGGFDAVLSNYILDEFVRILPGLAFNHMTLDEVQELAEEFRRHADMVDPAKVADAELRDPKDAPILGTLLAAQADYLITGDKDLLALSHKYPILTPASFWQRHGG